jgi:branched-chain amino acid transport system ATP-binding protein
MYIVFSYADKISVMNWGRVIATGTPVEIKNNDLVQKVYLGENAL